MSSPSRLESSATARPEIRWVTAFIDTPAAPAEVANEVETSWCRATGSTLSARRGADGAFATLIPPDGDPYLRVQRLRSGPARVHLDLHSEDADALAAAARASGATILHSEPGLVLLTSPGGFVFCSVDWEGESVIPRPGVDGRPDRVRLDIPAGRYDAEVAFWRAITGWESIVAGADTRLAPGAGLPPSPMGIVLTRSALTGGPAGPPEPDRIAGRVEFGRDHLAG